MLELIIISIILCPMFLLFVMASGNGMHYPNGRSSRRGGDFHPPRIVVGKPRDYKHGQPGYCCSIHEYLANQPGKLKYYNAHTHEFEDEPPKA